MERRSATNITEQLLGQLVHGYRIDELLGNTKTTAIYRLTAVETVHTEPRTITVFLLPEHFPVRARKRFLERVIREAASLVGLRHPHLFPVIGYGELAGTGYPYLLMPDAQVDTLAAHLRRQGRLAPRFAVALIERVAEVLEYAHHHGRLHRGLSPARLIYNEQVGAQLTGLDFIHLVELCGIEDAPLSYTHLRTISGSFFGDAHYLAPEVVRGACLMPAPMSMRWARYFSPSSVDNPSLVFRVSCRQADGPTREQGDAPC